jgi:hypothetical protein
MPVIGVGMSVEEATDRLVLATLEHFRGNRTRSAKVPAPEKQNHQWEIPEWTGGSIETATPCDLEN